MKKKSISKVETQDYIKGKNKKYMGQTHRDNLIVVSSAPLAGQVFHNYDVMFHLD